MSGTFGINVKMTIFGESHGISIGVILDGLPPGLAVDLEQIRLEMRRRSPGRNPMSTSRSEKDDFVIQSGFFNGFTTGTPLCAVIANSDQHSGDYSGLKDKPRPGHADFAGFVRYQGFNDHRGGGHFSGRLTAPLVFAGAVAKQALAKENVFVGAHILRVGDVADIPFDPLGESESVLKTMSAQAFPVLDNTVREKMQREILAAKEEQDSVGGVIEAMAINLPAGIGAPFFDSLESRLSHALFSIPAIKGVEFGDGFSIAGMRGSMANDCLYYKNGSVAAYSNHNGGITGGISNGMPIVLRVAVKPTPSIGLEQPTISLSEKRDTTVIVTGRHDPCIVQRAAPVVEGVMAWILWDMLLEAKKWEQSYAKA